jgi:putative hydrolase of the HAD superfamily
MPIDCVLLDAGGVLILPEHGMILDALAAAGASADPELIDGAHYAGMLSSNDSVGSIWPDYLRGYLGHLGLEQTDDVTQALMTAFRSQVLWKRVIESSLQALSLIAPKVAAVAVVSNSDGSAARQLMEASVCQVGEGPGVGVCAVIDSHVVGISKPDPGIFQLAVEAAGVPAERCVHVGDSVRADVRGALAAGIRPIHFDPQAMCADDSHDHAASLFEVLEVLN